MSSKLSRRVFIQRSAAVGIGMSAIPSFLSASSREKNHGMKLGLVTYQWAKDWDLPTIITNCEKTGVLGVELRTQHAHGVEANLNAMQRAEAVSYTHLTLPTNREV